MWGEQQPARVTSKSEGPVPRAVEKKTGMATHYQGSTMVAATFGKTNGADRGGTSEIYIYYSQTMTIKLMEELCKPSVDPR